MKFTNYIQTDRNFSGLLRLTAGNDVDRYNNCSRQAKQSKTSFYITLFKTV